jgi:hypothetical protein
MFDTLGRFQGLNDEMSFIVLHSLAEYPAWQAKAALTATLQQFGQAATGEGIGVWVGHTYGIIERFLPAQVKPMRAAQQQRWHFDFTAINRIHVPVALGSMLISGPHDRYGARMAWVATTVLLIAAVRRFAGDEARNHSLPARQEVGDADLVDLVADGAHVIAVRNVEHLGARNDFPERRG